MYRRRRKSKYNAQRYRSGGQRFDSKAELARYHDLQILQDVGDISDLQRQVRFDLVPSQKIDGRVVERPVYYVADFVYWQDGSRIVEDVKGAKTPEYVIKRKLMLWLHGIRIKEYKA